jgi:hypothetical protein
MKLLLSNNQLTRYSKSGDYATTTAIPLDGPLAVTAQTLLAWLQSQLVEGEVVGQVFLEPDGTHSDYETTVDAEGNESQSVTSTRAKVVRRRDRSRRRRFTLRCLLQRSPTRRTAGRPAGRMGRHRGDAVSYLQHHLSTVERGALGTFASLGSAAVSMVSHLEVYLRVAGLCVGLAVGIVTLLSVYHDLRRKQKEQK